MPLAEVILDGPLLRRGALRERRTTTERSGKGRILHADDAHVARAASGTLASHASGHLDLDGKVHGGGSGQAADADAGHVLGDGSVLEGGGVGAARGGVDLCGERAGAVLVDLVEGHGDGAVVGSGGEARGGALAGGGGDALLSGALGRLGACAGGRAALLAAAEEAAEELTFGGSGRSALGSLGGSTGGSCAGCAGTGAHERSNGSGGIDRATALSAAESRGLAAHLFSTDDGSIGLRAAKGRGAVTGSAISNYMLLERGKSKARPVKISYRKDRAC